MGLPWDRKSHAGAAAGLRARVAAEADRRGSRRHVPPLGTTSVLRAGSGFPNIAPANKWSPMTVEIPQVGE